MILLHSTNLFILEHKHRNLMAISSDDKEDDQLLHDNTEWLTNHSFKLLLIAEYILQDS